MKIILFNGPPRAGKDTLSLTIIDHLRANRPSFEQVPEVIHEKFSTPNKLAFAGMMKARMMDEFNVEYYEENKDEIIPCLGISYRQWQIDFSEKYMKPMYGIDIFGRLLWDRLTKAVSLTADYAVLSDCGFQVEVDYVLSHLPLKDVILFRLHRKGWSYDGDSRSYITLPDGGRQFDFHNDFDIETSGRRVWECVSDWME